MSTTFSANDRWAPGSFTAALLKLFVFVFLAAALPAAFGFELASEFSRLSVTPSQVSVDLPRLRQLYRNEPERFAAAVALSASTDNAGLWTTEVGRNVWRYAITVPGASSMSVSLKPGEWVDGEEVSIATATSGVAKSTRSYSHSNLNQDGELWSIPGKGDTLYLKVAAPTSSVRPHLDMLRVFVGFREEPTTSVKALVKQPGQTVNYECRASSTNDPPSRSVAAILINNQGQCTGNLLNNSSKNARLLFLTAKHCQANGTTISNFIVYWNQTTPCGQTLGDIFDATATSSGATHIADYQDGWLVQLSNPPPQSAHPYMAGFDATDSSISMLYGVHHANHLDKQYYEADNTPTKVTCDVIFPSGTVSAACWQTTASDGATDHGASGSGGFDSSNRLIGPLSTLFNDGSTGHQRLGPLYDNGFAASLDPSHGGVRIVEGMEYPGPFEQAPQVSISTSPTTVADGQTYTLTWSSVNAGACEASGQWGGNAPISGSEQVTASNPGTSNIQVTYTITCTNGAGQTAKSATETITPAHQPGPTVGVSASPSEIPRTSTATVTWSSTNATSCTASGAWSGTRATSGSATVGPFANAGNRTFVLACDGPGGNASGSANLTVREVPTITSFTASPTTATVGQTSTLSWSASNASSCTASGDWSGLQATSATYTTPAFTTARTYTYRLTCSNPDGDATPQSTTTVTVQSAPAPTVSLTTNHSSIHHGESATLSWTSSSATSCTASGDWSGSRTLTGSEAVSPSTIGTHSYTLTCTNSAGSTPSTTTISVVAATSPTVSLTTDHSSIHQGESAILSWTSSNATSCTAGGEWTGGKALSGSEAVSPSTIGSHTYSLTCTGAGGSNTSTATVTAAANAPTVSVTVNPTSITLGQSSTLSWTSSNATSCTASGDWSGNQAFTASTQVSPGSTGDHSYTLTCLNAGGSNSSTAVLHVNTVTGPPIPIVSLGANPTSITQGAGSTLTWSSTNASSCSASGDWSGSKATQAQESVLPSSVGDHVYSLTCTNVSGSGSASATVHVSAPVSDQDPTVTISASPTLISAGQSASLSWSSTNATSCQASGDWSGAQATSGHMALSPTSTGDHVYSITCINGAKSATSSASVHVDSTSSGGGASSSSNGGGAFGRAAILPFLLAAAWRRRAAGKTAEPAMNSVEDSAWPPQ